MLYSTAPPGEVHPDWTVGLQQASELPRRDPAVVGSVAFSLIGDAGSQIPECGVSCVRLVPAPSRQRYSHPGEAGHEEMGLWSSLPGLHQGHSSSLAVPKTVTSLQCVIRISNNLQYTPVQFNCVQSLNQINIFACMTINRLSLCVKHTFSHK